MYQYLDFDEFIYFLFLPVYAYLMLAFIL